jgi:hypothetical protein
MTSTISQVLGANYAMFYHPGLPVDAFTPVQTLSHSVKISNDLLNLYGRDFSCWNSRHHDTVAQLMNANWICQRLATEPICKPILVHQHNKQLVVDCGDTRIMALSAINHPAKLTAIITVRNQQADQYTDWIPVKSNQDLIRLCGFDPEQSSILLTAADADLDWCIDWLEIGDPSTSHHLHDINTRVLMLQAWINGQPADFKFSVDWVSQPIDWAEYQVTGSSR